MANFKPMFLVFGLMIVFSKNCEARLPVTVLYESLCPDSIRFIRNQLNSAYPKVKDKVDLLFVPFGKSDSINNGEFFTCQHGPAECVGNMIQACVLNELKGLEQQQVDFVTCQMSSNAEPSGRKCAENVGVAYSKVQECMNSNLGTQLQLEAEVITKNYSPTFIPTIIYNNKFDQRLQDRSLNAFARVVCEQNGLTQC